MEVGCFRRHAPCSIGTRNAASEKSNKELVARTGLVSVAGDYEEEEKDDDDDNGRCH